MLTDWKRKLAKASLLALALSSLQACANTAADSPAGVAQAYSTSGIVAVNPYNRTIFSTHNF